MSAEDDEANASTTSETSEGDPLEYATMYIMAIAVMCQNSHLRKIIEAHIVSLEAMVNDYRQTDAIPTGGNSTGADASTKVYELVEFSEFPERYKSALKSLINFGRDFCDAALAYRVQLSVVILVKKIFQYQREHNPGYGSRVNITASKKRLTSKYQWEQMEVDLFEKADNSLLIFLSK